MDEDLLRALSALVRIGIVNSVDTEKVRVRVLYDDSGMVSDWLPVIQQKHKAKDVSVSYYEGHTHSVKTENWLPDVGEQVLCLYLPCWNADGFVLGVIP